MKFLSSRLTALLLLTFAFGVIAHGQVTTSGSITGAVTDPQGAVVAGATIVARNNGTGQELTTTASDDGTFTIPTVPAGTYTVTVTSQGFKTLILKDVMVNVGTPSNIKGQLEIGVANETVTIIGTGGELLQTQSATVGQTITGRQILDLPQASRNALDLILLLPGSQTPGRPRQSTINGLPKGALNITMDGVNVQDNVLKGSDGFFTFVQPRVDSVEEVTISTSTPGAESAGEGAVQIKFVTKGGTNEYHGGVFWYRRDPNFNANFFYNNRDLPANPQTGKAPRTRQMLNQFGGKLGGPIQIPGIGYNRHRDKLFFFVDFEEYALPESQLRTRNILAPDAQNGIFTYTAGGVTRTVNVFQFAAGRGITNPTPDPTIGTLLSSIRSSASGGFVANTSDPNVQQLTFQNQGGQRRYFPTGRLDWNATKNNHVEMIYNYQQFKSKVDFLNNADPAFPGFPNFGSQDSNRFSYVAALRSTLGSHLVNEARFGLTGGTVLFFPGCNSGQFANQGGFALNIN
ncbi:MAG: carboxypeptidase-like regulatory domain-containing protein, partial [Acidobacteria bacterium]|nr:carboxypeptidase-like regulatory domain-containing protein [Acidobacteriota bacterium]